MRLDCFLADSCECAPPTDSLPMPYADLVLGWPMQRSLRRRLCDNGVRQQLAGLRQSMVASSFCN
jgi:hypothetical protein